MAFLYMDGSPQSWQARSITSSPSLPSASSSTNDLQTSATTCRAYPPPPSAFYGHCPGSTKSRYSNAQSLPTSLITSPLSYAFPHSPSLTHHSRQPGHMLASSPPTPTPLQHHPIPHTRTSQPPSDLTSIHIRILPTFSPFATSCLVFMAPDWLPMDGAPP